ncbi:MAG: stage II sporulation protein R [Oscillospiraceae bacterium]|nr:stage II sporulation protein R [Oscillospiraceae bacterium]
MSYSNLHSPKEHRRRRSRWLRRIALLSLCAFLWSVLGFQARCAGIRGQVLRLHVIASSDSELDQQAKLYVRDKLLLAGTDLFDGSVDAASAESVITPRVAELEACARAALQELGLYYPVKVTVGEEYFNTRTYEQAGITLPAGRYRAVCVVLGQGGGRNWWCVMFPPLCLPAARPRCGLDAILTGGQLRIVMSNPKYEIRFKLVEWWEALKERFDKPQK